MGKIGAKAGWQSPSLQRLQSKEKSVWLMADSLPAGQAEDCPCPCDTPFAISSSTSTRDELLLQEKDEEVSFPAGSARGNF